MKRSRAMRLKEWMHVARPFVGPTLLGVMVFCCSSALFVYRFRDDMLVLASLRAHALSVRSLVAIGARASRVAEIFTEPALIEYLHAFYDKQSPRVADPSVVETLLSAGASVSDRSETGWTPLMLAAASGQLPAAQVLIRHGAEVDARAFGETAEGMTALMAASMHGHSEVVQFLIQRGANVHIRSQSGFTSLLLAASRGHSACVQALLERGASVLLSTVQVAERNGHAEVAALLKQAMNESRGDSATRRPAKFPEE